jgi:hypothetical protein
MRGVSAEPRLSGVDSLPALPAGFCHRDPHDRRTQWRGRRSGDTAGARGLAPGLRLHAGPVAVGGHRSLARTKTGRHHGRLRRGRVGVVAAAPQDFRSCAGRFDPSDAAVARAPHGRRCPSADAGGRFGGVFGARTSPPDACRGHHRRPRSGGFHPGAAASHAAGWGCRGGPGGGVRRASRWCTVRREHRAAHTAPSAHLGGRRHLEALPPSPCDPSPTARPPLAGHRRNSTPHRFSLPSR